MELEEKEAKICRLCGLLSEYFVEVFKEEGLKRLLAEKIQSQIHISIRPEDGLPHIICLNCVAKLEYSLDFYNHCRDTQKSFLSKQTEILNDKINVVYMENDGESDKENIVPSPNKCPRSYRNCDKVIRSEKSSFLGEESPTQISEISSINSKIDESSLSNQSEIITRTTEETDQKKVSRKLILRKTRSATYQPAHFSPVTNKTRRTCVNESRIIQSNDDSNEIEAFNIPSTSNTKDSSKKSSINNDQSIHSVRTEEVFNRIDDSNEKNAGNKSVRKEKAKDIKCRLIKSNTIDIKKENVNYIIPHKMQVLESNQLASNSIFSQGTRVITTDINSTLSDTNPSFKDEAESNQQAVIQNNCKMDIQETSEQLEVQQNSNERYRRKKKLNKISDLITEEQKKKIETYYEKDMTVVNSEIVQENLTINNKKNIKCNICSILFHRLDKCKVHIWSHLNMKPYKCKLCNFGTGTISNVRCHIRKRHLQIKPFVCDMCGKQYVAAVQLAKHLNTHTGVRPFKCTVCGFTCNRRQIFDSHKTTHKQVKDIECSICKKVFKSKARLRTHMLNHNKANVVGAKGKVICKLCSVYLSSEMALERHMKNIHTRQYVCDICQKCLKSRKTLLNHKNVHSSPKYKCNLCSNVYKSNHILKEHLLKHKGIRKYKCEICEKSFAQKSHLDTHKAVHSDIKYHCPGCDHSFNRRDNMKMHTKRCKIFLSKPELKDLVNKKKRTIYRKTINDEVTPDTITSALKSNESLISTSKKTAINVMSRDTIIKKDNINQQNNNHQCVYNENIQNNDTIRSLKKTIQLPGSLTENTYHDMQEEKILTQNVLTSDCF